MTGRTDRGPTTTDGRGRTDRGRTTTTGLTTGRTDGQRTDDDDGRTWTDGQRTTTTTGRRAGRTDGQRTTTTGHDGTRRDTTGRREYPIFSKKYIDGLPVETDTHRHFRTSKKISEPVHIFLKKSTVSIYTQFSIYIYIYIYIYMVDYPIFSKKRHAQSCRD